MTLALHRLDHAERGERIDEQRRALRGGHAIGQHDRARSRRYDAILREHRAAEHRDGLADERLRVRACIDDDARTFVADLHRLIEARGHAGHAVLWNLQRRHHADRTRGRRIGRTEQQAHIRRIDRRGLDAHHDLVGTGRRHHDLDERQLELAFGRHARMQLEAFAIHTWLVAQSQLARRTSRSHVSSAATASAGGSTGSTDAGHAALTASIAAASRSRHAAACAGSSG